MNYSLACFSSFQRIRAAEITQTQFHSRCSAPNCTSEIGYFEKYNDSKEETAAPARIQHEGLCTVERVVSWVQRS